jgi:hypothetical protein
MFDLRFVIIIVPFKAELQNGCSVSTLHSKYETRFATWQHVDSSLILAQTFSLVGDLSIFDISDRFMTKKRLKT